MLRITASWVLFDIFCCYTELFRHKIYINTYPVVKIVTSKTLEFWLFVYFVYYCILIYILYSTNYFTGILSYTVKKHLVYKGYAKYILKHCSFNVFTISTLKVIAINEKETYVAFWIKMSSWLTHCRCEYSSQSQN